MSLSCSNPVTHSQTVIHHPVQLACAVSQEFPCGSHSLRLHASVSASQSYRSGPAVTQPLHKSWRAAPEQNNADRLAVSKGLVGKNPVLHLVSPTGLTETPNYPAFFGPQNTILFHRTLP